MKEHIPCSIAAIQQAFATRTNERAVKRLKRSPRYTRLRPIDNTLPSKAYLQLMKFMTRRLSSLIVRLRAGHAPLNKHLFDIKVSENTGCEACRNREDESVRYYLLSCPAYEPARRTLRHTIGTRNASNIAFLLGKQKALRALFIYMDQTKRFKNLLGTVSGNELNEIIYD
jgi:hypothetical protein